MADQLVVVDDGSLEWTPDGNTERGYKETVIGISVSAPIGLTYTQVKEGVIGFLQNTGSDKLDERLLVVEQFVDDWLEFGNNESVPGPGFSDSKHPWTPEPVLGEPLPAQVVESTLGPIVPAEPEPEPEPRVLRPDLVDAVKTWADLWPEPENVETDYDYIHDDQEPDTVDESKAGDEWVAAGEDLIGRFVVDFGTVHRVAVNSNEVVAETFDGDTRQFERGVLVKTFDGHKTNVPAVGNLNYVEYELPENEAINVTDYSIDAINERASDTELDWGLHEGQGTPFEVESDVDVSETEVTRFPDAAAVEFLKHRHLENSLKAMDRVADSERLMGLVPATGDLQGMFVDEFGEVESVLVYEDHVTITNSWGDSESFEKGTFVKVHVEQ